MDFFGDAAAKTASGVAAVSVGIGAGIGSAMKKTVSVKPQGQQDGGGYFPSTLNFPVPSKPEELRVGSLNILVKNRLAEGNYFVLAVISS